MATLHEDGFYYDYFSALTEDERKVNALYIAAVLRGYGFTDNAIAGMLGNIHAESNINPARWEGNTDWRAQGVNSKGFGLTQWTPWRKYTQWCEDKNLLEYHMDTALLRIWTEFFNVQELNDNKETWGGGQYYSTSEFPMTRSEFVTSTESPGYLAQVFVRNYERPASVLKSDDETQEEHEAAKAATYERRASLAEMWWEYITGTPAPDIPTPGTGTSSSSRSKILDLILYTRRRPIRVVR